MAHMLTAHAKAAMAEELRCKIASVVFFDADGKELVVVNSPDEVADLADLIKVVDR